MRHPIAAFPYDAMPAGTDTTRTAGAGESLPALMSHDLRTPLGPIALAVSAIADDSSAPESVRELASFAAAQCARLARIIDAALWAVRGARTGTPKPVDLHEVARAAVAGAESLRLRCSLDVDTSSRVPLDPRAGREALIALIEAAAGEDEPAWVVVGVDIATPIIRIGGPALPLCVRAADAEGPADWRAAYVLGATAVVEAHGGSVTVGPDSIDVRLPVA